MPLSCVDIVNFIVFCFFFARFHPNFVFCSCPFFRARLDARRLPATLLCWIVSADLTSTPTCSTRSRRLATDTACHTRHAGAFAVSLSSALRFASVVAPMINFSLPRLPLPDRLLVVRFTTSLFCFLLHANLDARNNRRPVTSSSLCHESCPPRSLFGPSRRSFRCACRGCRAARHRSFVIKRRGLHAPSYAPAIAVASRDCILVSLSSSYHRRHQDRERSLPLFIVSSHHYNRSRAELCRGRYFYPVLELALMLYCTTLSSLLYACQ